MGKRDYAERRKNAACAQLSSPQANFQRKSHAHKREREKDAEMNTVNTQNELLNGCSMGTVNGYSLASGKSNVSSKLLLHKEAKRSCNKANECSCNGSA